MNEIGNIIRTKRIEKGISLNLLSKITNISISTLSKLENNKCKNISSIYLYRLCKVLNLNYELLLRKRWEIFPTFLYERKKADASKSNL